LNGNETLVFQKTSKGTGSRGGEHDKRGEAAHRGIYVQVSSANCDEKNSLSIGGDSVFLKRRIWKLNLGRTTLPGIVSPKKGVSEGAATKKKR